MTPNQTIQRLAHAVVQLNDRATPDTTIGRLRLEGRAQSVLLTVLVGAVFYVLTVVMQLHQQLAVMQQTLAAIAAKVGTL